MSALDETLHSGRGVQHALVEIDRARRGEPPDLLRISELWEGMNDGRWSVVEHFERDGHRYFLLCSAALDARVSTRLSKREQQVLDLVNRGCSNKIIGYSLNLSISTVSTHLARARRKLRAARERVCAQTVVDALGP